MTRQLAIDGLFNARDLGGLPAAGGRTTRWGAVVRSENLDRLGPAGWEALRAHGIATVVDLRNDDERDDAPDDAVTGVRTVHVPLDGAYDGPFWDVYAPRLFATPLYYRPFLEEMPERAAAVVAAVARAEPGGVLVHCAGGRDRTGLVALLLLAIAGVDAGTIAADHELSAVRSADLHAFHGMADQAPAIRALLTEAGTSWSGAVEAVLAGLDVERLLLGAGLSPSDLDAARGRLLKA